MSRKPAEYTHLVLPSTVVSRGDVARLVHEVERIDSDLTAQAVRAKVTAGSEAAIPLLSEQLSSFLEQNNLSILEKAVRSTLIRQLRALREHAPVVHMTFATTADPDSLATLAQWLRQSIHPQAVIIVGLQPSLIAGVHVRTPNHVYDLSLRSKLDGGHGTLVRTLQELRT